MLNIKDDLAENLLTRVMGWTPLEASKEIPDLQLLAQYKYDEYQQYSTGMRFIENFALWLSQFKSLEERIAAYKFIRTNLVYFSADEVRSLVSRAFPEIIVPYIMQLTSKVIGTKQYQVGKIVNSTTFRRLLRQSLFLGLSDGAQIDFLRRSNNSKIYNEQVFQTYDLSKRRVENMLRELEKDLKTINPNGLSDEDRKFKIVFLLDDFSASGLSYVRNEFEGNNPYGGKIARFLYDLEDESSPTARLVNYNDVRVCIVLYLATDKGIKALKEKIGSGFQSFRDKIEVKSVYSLKDEISITNNVDRNFLDMLKNYYDPVIETSHYKKGKHRCPYLGYDECGLPLILSHNTPNNSLPILWFDENMKYIGLFPRISRHQGETE